MTDPVGRGSVRVECNWLGATTLNECHVGSVAFDFGSKKTANVVQIPSGLQNDSDVELSFQCNSKTTPGVQTVTNSLDVSLKKLKRLTLTASLFNGDGVKLLDQSLMFFNSGEPRVLKFEDITNESVTKLKAGQTVQILFSIDLEGLLVPFVVVKKVDEDDHEEEREMRCIENTYFTVHGSESVRSDDPEIDSKMAIGCLKFLLISELEDDEGEKRRKEGEITERVNSLDPAVLKKLMASLMELNRSESTTKEEEALQAIEEALGPGAISAIKSK